MAYDSAGKWNYEDDSVASRVAAITSGGSPLMKQAATTGMQVANRRGLGNSSMAAGAAQQSVIAAATPIASQESQQVAQKNALEMQNRQQTSMAVMEDARARDLAANDITFKTGLASQEDRRMREMQTQSIGADAIKTDKTIAAQQQERIAASLAEMSSQRFNANANLLQNKDIPADVRGAAQASFNAQYDSTVNYLSNLYGVKLSNATPSSATAPTTQAPVTTTAPKTSIQNWFGL